MEQPKKTPRPKEKHDLLYARCITEKPVGETFSTAELTAFGIAKDEADLLDIVQELVRRYLFVTMALSKGLLYRTRSKATAIK